MKENPWWEEGWRQIKKKPLNRSCLYFIGIISLVALLAPWITPYPFDEQHMGDILVPPNFRYWCGTDALGRDLFSRIIYGSRVSLTVGLVTTLVSFIIGALYGAISGWLGGWVDLLMMRLVDMTDSLPSLVIMILIQWVLDHLALFSHSEWESLVGTLLALSLVGWMGLARLVRSQVLQGRQMGYMEAGLALGLGPWRLLWNHVFPNIMGPLMVMLSFRIPSHILMESFFKFYWAGLATPL